MDILVLIWVFHLRNWAIVMVFLGAIVSHVLPDAILYHLLQFDTAPGSTGELVGAGAAEVVVGSTAPGTRVQM
jgi:hypothetical protein